MVSCALGARALGSAFLGTPRLAGAPEPLSLTVPLHRLSKRNLDLITEDNAEDVRPDINAAKEALFTIETAIKAAPKSNKWREKAAKLDKSSKSKEKADAVEPLRKAVVEESKKVFAALAKVDEIAANAAGGAGGDDDDADSQEREELRDN